MAGIISPSSAPCAFFHSLWIDTMNRCTLAPRGQALLCLAGITASDTGEAA